MRYNTVCVAGTFDGLHKGHERLLRAAFSHGESVIVALTTDLFVRMHKSKDSISSFHDRKLALTDWLQRHSYEKRATIIGIDDPIGPAATADFDALVVTSQTKDTAAHINELRQKHDKGALAIILVPLVTADDHKAISSSRIRAGEIDRHGHLVMPHHMREVLGEPLGTLLHTKNDIESAMVKAKEKIVVTVGDMTSKTALTLGLAPRLVIFDNKVNRKVFTEVSDLVGEKGIPVQKVQSGPGFISQKAQDIIKQWVNNPKQRALEVDGEEDLLTLPVVLYAPLEAVVYYGQPSRTTEPQGIVEIVVTEKIKTKVKKLLQTFTVKN